MRRSCKHLLISGIFFLTLSILPAVLTAQPNPGDCDNQDPDLPPCPVDGGLSLLVVAGIAYGAKKINYNRDKKTVELI